MGSSDGSADVAAAHAREERRARIEARLESLGEQLHPGCTESLRTRWARELLRAHAEYLALGERDRATALRHWLVDEVLREHTQPLSALVRQQFLAWAQVCRDAMHAMAQDGQHTEALALLPQLEAAAHQALPLEGGAVAWCEGLEIAHAIAVRQRGELAAVPLLESLRALATAHPCPETRSPLARALATAIARDLHVGARERAGLRLRELRQQARRAWACEPERTALAHALLASHEHDELDDRASIEHELGSMARRPGADQEQRNLWARAVGSEPRRGRRVQRRPTEALRTRAYRSSDHESITALFERLEAELPERQGSFLEHIAVLNEMRALAARDEADPTLRLRFARHWLTRDFDARRYDHGAVANDRSAYTWSRVAARSGDPEAQVLLGRCLAGGRGTPRDRAAAAQWYRRAGSAGHDEAEYCLRAMGFERLPWLRHRYTAFTLAGLAMLIIYFVGAPLPTSWWGVLAYLGVSLGALPLYEAIDAVGGPTQAESSSTDDTSPAEAGDDASESGVDQGLGYVFGAYVDQFARRPLGIVKVATEDGLVLAPLAWLGITPWTALLAGVVFGLIHYPVFSWRSCLVKAIDYAAIAWFVLPWAGLWPIVVGHIAWDVGVLLLGLRWRRRARRSAP